MIRQYSLASETQFLALTDQELLNSKYAYFWKTLRNLLMSLIIDKRKGKKLMTYLVHIIQPSNKANNNKLLETILRSGQKQQLRSRASQQCSCHCFLQTPDKSGYINVSSRTWSARYSPVCRAIRTRLHRSRKNT